MRRLVSFLESVAGFCLLLVGVVVFGDVLGRYVFLRPIPWSTDVIRITFVFTLFIGMSVGVLKNAHLNIDLFVGLLPTKVKRVLLFLTDFCLMVFMILLMITSVPFVVGNVDQFMPYLPVPMSFVYSVVPILALCTTIGLGINMIKDFKK